MEYLIQPPASDEVNASTLSRIFVDVTTSYKFLFFLALLENVERRLFEPEVPISLHEIALDMLALAWYPHVYFRLSFGRQDMVAANLDSMEAIHLSKGQHIHPWDKTVIRSLIAEHADTKSLRRYVPFRLLRPFFPEAHGVKDHEVHERIAELTSEYFVSRKPLYKFGADRKTISMHPAWCKYFEMNLCVLRGWAWWHFLQYMQRCNPSVPGISNKLYAPPQRDSLKAQTKFWREALIATEFHCIYSGEIISAEQFSLDHFVPWSFVVHDQLWNLLPTSKSINSKKSDKLPADTYFKTFVESQHQAMCATRETLQAQVWQGYLECYIADLGLPTYEALLNREQLFNAYELNLRPLMQLARANGFEHSWTYKENESLL